MQTKSTILKYNFIIYKENSHYITDVPALGISNFDKTVQQAKKNLQKAITCHLEGLQKTQSEIPAPYTEFPYVNQTEVTFSSNFAPSI